MPGLRRSEKEWLLELLNEPSAGFGEFCVQLKQLEVEGRKLARVYAWRKVKKRIGRLGSNQQDAILPHIKAKRIKKAYELFRDSEDAINAKLLPYASAPKLFFDISAKRWGCTESWQEENPKTYLALRYLARMVASGRLGKIRRCANCGNWFLARPKNQTCCSTRCRGKLSSQDASFKAIRRAYMREYRANQKRRTLKGVSTR